MDDLADVALVVFLTVLAVGAIWALLDRRSPAARGFRQAFGGLPRLILMFLAIATFAVLAEDVLEHETSELVLQLDRRLSDGARALASAPAIRAAATALTHATGEWLGLGVLVAGAVLVGAGRRRDGLVLLSGTLGAWLLHVALKVAFRIPRPNAPLTRHLVTGYGFPSGHALVTLTACGLLAWILGRSALPRVRVALWAAAATVTVLAAAARVVKGVHWPSDVVAGLAVAAIWLNAVTLVGEPRDAGTPRGGVPPARARGTTLPLGSMKS
jgi:undecaprenyl-diphosphatase